MTIRDLSRRLEVLERESGEEDPARVAHEERLYGDWVLALLRSMCGEGPPPEPLQDGIEARVLARHPAPAGYWVSRLRKLTGEVEGEDDPSAAAAGAPPPRTDRRTSDTPGV
jgi:hypothetical protein